MIQEEIIFSANEYIQRYETILKEYLNKNFNEFNEQDFITYQINRYKKYHDWKAKIKLYNIVTDGLDIDEEQFFLTEFYKKGQQLLHFSDKPYIFDPSEDIQKGIYYCGEFDEYLITNIKKIVEFLEEKLKSNKNIVNSDDFIIDLSDTTGIERIIFLKKLGVLDFLRKQYPFNQSVNSLANVISAVTGTKANYVQSMLNPLFSTFADQRHNPLNSTDTLNKVENQLIKIGYNLNSKT